ncbi:hypothetical protein BOTBODRAFT_171944 [Botryobasidium botryosum FD-172 SS1]|uniref:Proteasome assembly chaperone 3 n=1 Tax=Botryobasidium botryosum (strain FD-172 SS1) TaxID=930990 RepID=A0A067MRX1_BOTB1|nr:hypothetical protein BOTBODRAFT_171944 [Botryobasidium botryosum FD-172 SS1]
MSLSPHRCARAIDGDHTEVVVQFYADRVLVLVTQLNKIGSLIQATLPDSYPLAPAPAPALPSPPAAILLTPLLGCAPSTHEASLYDIYAAQIATLVWTCKDTHGRRAVIAGIALKRQRISPGEDGLTEQDRGVFAQVMDMVRVCMQGA